MFTIKWFFDIYSKKIMVVFQTIKERWKSETPKFFRGVKKTAITLGSSATAVWVTNESMSLELHENILQVCKYIIAASAAMGLTAQLTKVDNDREDLQS